MILVKEGLTYDRWRDLDIFIEKQVESVFIDLLTKNNKHITIGGMYRPPNINDDVFMESIFKIKHKLSLEKEKN